MSNYTDARDKLVIALSFVVPDGPEWIKTKASIMALDQAEVAEIERDFINATRRLDDAVAKLRSILTGLAPNAASQFLTEVRGALQLLTPVVQTVEALLSGEPASERTVAKLGHGGILTRSQRFRFPPYARELDAPDG